MGSLLREVRSGVGRELSPVDVVWFQGSPIVGGSLSENRCFAGTSARHVFRQWQSALTRALRIIKDAQYAVADASGVERRMLLCGIANAKIWGAKMLASGTQEKRTLNGNAWSGNHRDAVAQIKTCTQNENLLESVPAVALMRKLALNLARLTDGGRVTSVRGKLKRAGWDDGFLLKLVRSATGFAEDPEPEKIQMR